MNHKYVNSTWAGTSTGIYIYFDKSTGKYILSKTSLADTTHSQFVDPNSTKGSWSGGAIPPHPRTGFLRNLFGVEGSLSTAAYVLRQYEYGYDRSATYQSWADTINGLVFVGKRVGDDFEVFTPQ